MSSFIFQLLKHIAFVRLNQDKIILFVRDHKKKYTLIETEIEESFEKHMELVKAEKRDLLATLKGLQGKM